jgi:phosphoribosylglycinamide formyltransferase 1
VTPLVARAPCPPDAPLRVGVLVSGSGSNLQAVLDHAAAPGARYLVAVVVSNVPGAYALERARAAGVEAIVVPHKGRERADFERELVDALRARGVELVVLAGFMRVLGAAFLDVHAPRIVNVHPALCPAFPGMHAAKQALDHGAKITGCTVHLVDAGVDTGPILAQAAVPVLPDDDEAALQRRIQAEEHRLLPLVIDAIAAGAVVIDDAGRVRSVAT